MKIFVASSFLNKKETRKVIRTLRKAGHEITVDWTLKKNCKQALQVQAEVDAEGVSNADVLVVLWPGRSGTITEVGIAIGIKNPVYILGELDVYNIYWHHSLVKRVPTISHLIEELKEK